MNTDSLKKAVLLASPLVGLLVAECWFRFRAWTMNRDTLADAFTVVSAEPRGDGEDGRVRFRDIIRPSGNDRVIYELRPDLDTTYKGGALSTNSRGLRSPRCPSARSRGRSPCWDSEARTCSVTALPTTTCTPGTSSAS